MYTTGGLGVDEHIASLRRQVQETESQLRHLKGQLEEAEASRVGQNLEVEWQAEVIAALAAQDGSGRLQDDGGHGDGDGDGDGDGYDGPRESTWPAQEFALSREEYKRFGRQLIVPEIGLEGQLRLRSARVLVVGVGGLGCPAAAYLAGAGVGTLGLVDGDTVELSNLHRQIAHSSIRVGSSKVDSAMEYLSGLNPNVNYIPHRNHLVPQQALDIFTNYDLVLDCTDHPTSRYLISDACVLAGKPLVSASALRTEGQLTVLNNPPRPPGSADGGPCYRCVFPKPPPAASVVSCGEGGILGPVVGVMGVLQALEAIKLIASGIDFGADDEPASSVSSSSPSPCPFPSSPEAATPSSPSPKSTPPQPTLLLFSAYNTPQFRTARLRPTRRVNCASCSASTTISPQSLQTGSTDYIAFCGGGAGEGDNPFAPILAPADRLAPRELASLLLPGNASSGGNGSQSPATVLIDVRERAHFELCALPGAINIPWSSFAEKLRENEDEFRALRGVGNSVIVGGGGAVSAADAASDARRDRDVVVVCRLGNDSQLAVKMMRDINGGGLRIRDLRGGLRAWGKEVDASWPDY